MRADARRPEHPRALTFQRSGGGHHVRHLERQMMLTAARIAREETMDRRPVPPRLEQLDLAIVEHAETHSHALRFQHLRRSQARRAQRVAVKRNRAFQTGRGNADMVEATDHACGVSARGRRRLGISAHCSWSSGLTRDPPLSPSDPAGQRRAGPGS